MAQNTNYLPKVRATKEQRRILTNYLSNGGDKVDAYWKGIGKNPNPEWSKQRLARRARAYFDGATMKALMAEADIETRLRLENRAIHDLDSAIAKHAITKEKILDELAKIAFAQQTDVASWGPDGVIIKDSSEIGDAASAVAEVSQTGGGEQPVNVKVKLHDKQAALKLLGRELYGMFADKVEHKGVVAVAAKFVIEGR